MNWRGHLFSNGYTIVAHKQDEGHPKAQIILAMAPGAPDTACPYVVAHYLPGDTEWYWGNYFRTIEAAVTDYSER